jgi:hypothetical protein
LPRKNFCNLIDALKVSRPNTSKSAASLEIFFHWFLNRWNFVCSSDYSKLKIFQQKLFFSSFLEDRITGKGSFSCWKLSSAVSVSFLIFLSFSVYTAANCPAKVADSTFEALLLSVLTRNFKSATRCFDANFTIFY